MLVNMDMTTVGEKENPFLKRKEINVILKHPASATPSKAELIKTLASNNSVDEAQIVIDYIFTKKGIAESLAKVKILKEKPKEVKQVEKPIESEQKGEKAEAQASKAA